MVILDDDDIAELPSPSSREIAVEKFVPREQIDPMLVREVLLPRAGEDRRQALRACCARRCSTPTGWPW